MYIFTQVVAHLSIINKIWLFSKINYIVPYPVVTIRLNHYIYDDNMYTSIFARYYDDSICYLFKN